MVTMKFTPWLLPVWANPSKSILEGVELAASFGVVASIVPHTPMRKAVYEDFTPPTVARMLYLYEEALSDI